MERNLGNAAKVNKDLQAMVDEKKNVGKPGNTPAKGSENKEGEKKKEKINVAEVQLNAQIAAVNAMEGLTPEMKATLIANMQEAAKKAKDAIVTHKEGIRDAVKKMLTDAGEQGITKNAMVCNFAKTKGLPELTEEQAGTLVSFVTNVNWFVQPSFYKKEGWDVVTKEQDGKVYYGIKAPKTVTK